MTREQMYERKGRTMAIVVSIFNAVPVYKVMVYAPNSKLHSSLYIDNNDDDSRRTYLNKIFELDQELFTDNIVVNLYLDYVAGFDTYEISLIYSETTDIIDE